MKDIAGKPMLWHVIERVGHALENSISFFRGSEDDVLKRYLDCSHNYEIDLTVRITSDCPLIDPQTVDKTIRTHINSNADYTSNTLERTFPRGLDVEVFSTELLERIDKLTSEKYQREHVTPYFYENPDRFQIQNISAEGQLRHPEIRLSVDTEEDLQFIREIYKRLYKPPSIIEIENVMELLDRNPELLLINKDVQQKRLKD
jgi:spore coat polysaccharide biosynthesis protein SpsF